MHVRPDVARSRVALFQVFVFLPLCSVCMCTGGLLDYDIYTQKFTLIFEYLMQFLQACKCHLQFLYLR